MREFMYPLLQGYDSVAMNVDMEIGGSDQTFNMLCGRQLVKQYLNKEKFVLTVPLLTDANGNKIGKTEGNVIALTSAPNDLYGMIMNLPDSVIDKCFEYITQVPMEEVDLIKEKLKNGENPMNFKKKLAFELVKMLNNVKDAINAQSYFESVFQKKSTLGDIKSVHINDASILITDLLVQFKLCNSKSEAKRLIKEGAVDIDNDTTTDINQYVSPKNDMIIKVGKHKIIKLKTKNYKL